MNSNTRKILHEYEVRADLYKKFTGVVQFILEDILKQGGYKYHIYSRLKKKDSLKEKIERKKHKGKIYKNLEDIKDVAGARVIFYTESERKKFTAKLKKEFGDSIKIENPNRVSGYRATHAIISLGKERLRLAEYRAFKGLEIEIQLCLVLERAWAEIAHDILYKENLKLKPADKIRYFFLKERMQRLMKKHIHEASIELERIVSKLKKLKKGNKKANSLLNYSRQPWQPR